MQPPLSVHDPWAHDPHARLTLDEATRYWNSLFPRQPVTLSTLTSWTVRGRKNRHTGHVHRLGVIWDLIDGEQRKCTTPAALRTFAAALHNRPPDLLVQLNDWQQLEQLLQRPGHQQRFNRQRPADVILKRRILEPDQQQLSYLAISLGHGAEVDLERAAEADYELGIVNCGVERDCGRAVMVNPNERLRLHFDYPGTTVHILQLPQSLLSEQFQRLTGGRLSQPIRFEAKLPAQLERILPTWDEFLLRPTPAGLRRILQFLLLDCGHDHRRYTSVAR